MEEHKLAIYKWLDIATGEIRFPPDQRAVRAELEAHLEDKTADFQRIFPDMTVGEAQEKAISEMGDPAELGKALAKVHRPWLGYLWRASQLAGLVLLTAYLVLCLEARGGYQHPLWGRPEPSYGTAQSQRARLGGYTFRVTGAAFLDYPEARSHQDLVQLTLRVSSPRFWERIDPDVLQSAMTAVGPDGTRWAMNYGALEVDTQKDTQYWSHGLVNSRWGLFDREFVVWLDIQDWQEGDRIRLDFNFDKGNVSLTVDELERVVME